MKAGALRRTANAPNQSGCVPDLVNVDRVQRQTELGGTLFAILLAELVLLPLELDHLLMRRLEQMIAPDGILLRAFRHGRDSHCCARTRKKSAQRGKVQYRRIAEV